MLESQERYDEAAGQITLEVNLSTAMEEVVTVPYAIEGSASEGDDFLPFEPAGMLEFEQLPIYRLSALIE